MYILSIGSFQLGCVCIFWIGLGQTIFVLQLFYNTSRIAVFSLHWQSWRKEILVPYQSWKVYSQIIKYTWVQNAPWVDLWQVTSVTAMIVTVIVIVTNPVVKKLSSIRPKLHMFYNSSNTFLKQIVAVSEFPSDLDKCFHVFACPQRVFTLEGRRAWAWHSQGDLTLGSAGNEKEKKARFVVFHWSTLRGPMDRAKQKCARLSGWCLVMSKWAMDGHFLTKWSHFFVVVLVLQRAIWWKWPKNKSGSELMS